MSEIGYLFELVGGPFDGCADLGGIAEGEDELPERLYVGVCRGGGMCSAPDCDERRGRHVQWWEDVEETPVEAFVYTRESVETYPDYRVGKATYAFGGVGELRELREFVDTEAERELLTPVGHAMHDAAPGEPVRVELGFHRHERGVARGETADRRVDPCEDRQTPLAARDSSASAHRAT